MPENINSEIGRLLVSVTSSAAQSGEVDYPTWYQISSVYVAVPRISEPG